MKLASLIFAAALLSSNASARADVLWDELVNGPFSSSYQSPTALGPLFNPSSQIFGAVEHVYEGNGNYTVTADFFTFTVPGGFQLDSIDLTVSRPNTWLWLGPDFASQLGFTFSATSGSLLLQLGLPSLPEGTYAIYLEHMDLDGANSSSVYSLSFSISPVPEPSALSLIALGVLSSFVFAARHARKRRPFKV